nr:DUF4012 domain-containing protein [Candidatus Levybacteria bacterium]
MNHTALISLEKKHEYPILIIDKRGVLGEALAYKLKIESLVILVSKNISNREEGILHIPYLKKFPTIPDNIYSHIFLIDEELEISKDIIKPLIKKIKKDNSFFIFAVNADSINEEFNSAILSSYDNANVVVIGDIFSRNEIYNPRTYVNKFIYQAKTLGRINVPEDGGEETRPVFFDDVVTGFLEVAFSPDKNYKIYYLFPKHTITLLMLAHEFQKKDPDIKISFVSQKKTKPKYKFIPKKDGKYIYTENYNISEKIKKINFQNLNIVDDINKKHKEKEEGDGFRLSLVTIFLVSFLTLPLVISLLFSFLGFNSLLVVKKAFNINNFAIAKSSAGFSLETFSIAKRAVDILEEEVSLIGQKEKVEEFRKKIDLGIESSSGIISFINATEKYKNIASGLSKNPSDDFFKAQTDFKNALYLYSKEKESGIMPDFIKTKLSDAINISSATIDFWPDIFGFNRQKTYLILFQNNMEIRPGGGFIGSYGILTLEKGKMLGFKIYDVYDADGQLKAHVEPPFPIRRFLPSQHWYLRDSNFNLDFSKGAVASAIFLNSEMHQPVDGVIGVDLYFVKNLLSVTGPVEVLDYKETVNDDNFYQIMQEHAQKDFFAGSTQKKDFLRSFYNALVTKITESKNLSYINLLKAVTTSIYEKHILFAFNDPNIQAAFAINGWSSALFDERKNGQGIVNDFMGVNEANLGANKVNYYVTRSLSQEASIMDDGTVSENLTIAYKNASKDLVYKNYLRIELPMDTNINKIIIDGKEQKLINAIDDPVVYEKKNFKAPEGLEVKKESQAQNSIYGFLININPKDLKVIQLFYDLPEKLTLINPEFSYSLKLFKQPGIDFYPYGLSLNYPQGFKVVKSPNDIKVTSDKLIFSSQITRDRELKINFGAK